LEDVTAVRPSSAALNMCVDVGCPPHPAADRVGDWHGEIPLLADLGHSLAG